jgi:hypothetical protein
MAKRTKSKGMLKQIGDAVTAGAEAVADAGAKAAHMVTDLFPASSTPTKKIRKSSPKTPKLSEAKTTKSTTPKPKAAAPRSPRTKAAASARTAAPKTKRTKTR